MPRVPPVLASAMAAGLLLAGCGRSGHSGSTITVFAAASLREAFTTLGTGFESAHPGAEVVFNFGPSSGLATQISQGAPADVFASASEKNMTQVTAAGGATAPITFATNAMTIAVPVTNPAGISSLADLARPGVKVAVCQAAVPCGVTAARVFANAGLTVRPVTEEVDVKGVLSKVTLGEVDAGIVYVTDVRAAGDKVTGIEIPRAVNAGTSYPIAMLTKAHDKATSRAFIEYVHSAAGTDVLAAAGFAGPGATPNR